MLFISGRKSSQNTPNIKTFLGCVVSNSNHPPDPHKIQKVFKVMHEKTILQLYKVTKLRIINGRFFKDKNIGKFTCHESKGSPVLDYLLIAPAGRPRCLSRRRNIISSTCKCVRVCVRGIAGQYGGEHSRKTHRERALAVSC